MDCAERTERILNLVRKKQKRSHKRCFFFPNAKRFSLGVCKYFLCKLVRPSTHRFPNLICVIN